MAIILWQVHAAAMADSVDLDHAGRGALDHAGRGALGALSRFPYLRGAGIKIAEMHARFPGHFFAP